MEKGSSGSEGRGRARRQAQKDAQRAEATRRAFIVGGSAAVVAAVGGAYLLSGEHEDKRSLKEVVSSFTWEDGKNPEKRNVLLNKLADSYMEFTKSSRVTKQDLLKRTQVFTRTQDYQRAVRTADSRLQPNDRQWGYTLRETKQTFVDLELLQKLAPQHAGLALTNAFDHEWFHQDIEERTEGALLNNPQFGFPLPNGQLEPFRKYSGGIVLTDTRTGLIRFDEVWTESMSRRFVKDQMGIQELPIHLEGDYLQNGVDVFEAFTVKAGIATKQLYDLHATSDDEQMASLLGEKLPGTNDSNSKGREVMIGVNEGNRNRLQQVGMFTLLQ